jgi:hypothetical protein
VQRKGLGKYTMVILELMARKYKVRHVTLCYVMLCNDGKVYTTYIHIHILHI